MGILKRLFEYARAHGAMYTVRRSGQKAAEFCLGLYDRKWRRSKASPEELEFQRRNQPDAGLISVVIPVYNTDPLMLEALLLSLCGQSYQNWEAILYDGCSTKKGTGKILEEYKKKDDRLKVISGEVNEGISGNTNRAAALASGQYLALCDHDDLLSPDALWRIAEAISKEKPDMLYSDEDMITEGGLTHISPHFKPDLCPENLNSGNYICHLLVMRKDLFFEVGGLRPEFDGSQDHDLALRLMEKARVTAHLPRTLYHWRKVRSSMSHSHLDRCLEAGSRAVKEHLERQGLSVRTAPVNKEIRVWIDVPGAPSVETVPMTTYSEANRMAARSSADFLFFADPGLVMESPDTFLNELMMYAQLDGVGAVTPVLMNRRKRITHGGFALGLRGTADCVNEGLFVTAGGWHDLMNVVHNVSAVSPCAMMIRRDRFIPFDEEYRTGLGAVDLCLRLSGQGLRHVYTPHAKAVCENRELLLLGQKRNPEDLERFTAKWGSELKDPCYGSRFSKKKANYSIP